MIRVRPTNEREIDLAGDACSLQERGSSSLHLRVDERAYDFKFDEVLGSDGSQEELFQRANSAHTHLIFFADETQCLPENKLGKHCGLSKRNMCCSCWDTNGKQRYARIQCLLLCLWSNWRRKNTYNARRAAR